MKHELHAMPPEKLTSGGPLRQGSVDSGLSDKLRRWLGSSLGARVADLLMAARTLPLIGIKYKCPCCGWSFRRFTSAKAILRAKPKGYCPRCNSKPRHRWLWMFLQEETDVFTEPTRLLHLSPAYSMARSLRKLPHLDYYSADLSPKRKVDVQMDLSEGSFKAQSFDAIICVHVLEHIAQDRNAIGHLHRMVKSDGWVLIAVPMRFDQKTFEDASITAPEERRTAFGEPDHFRLYGHDLVDRLCETGFEVDTFRAGELPDGVLEKYGLKSEEVMLFCRRKAAA